MTEIEQTALESERDTALALVQTLYAGERALRVAFAKALGRPDAASRWAALIRAAGDQRAERDAALERLRRAS